MVFDPSQGLEAGLEAFFASAEQALNEGKTILLLAASYGHVDVVKLFFDRGADVNAPDRWNNTSLSELPPNDTLHFVRVRDSGASCFIGNCTRYLRCLTTPSAGL